MESNSLRPVCGPEPSLRGVVDRACTAPENAIAEVRRHERTVTAVLNRCLNHLQTLEAESLSILREAVAEFARPVMPYSIGKIPASWCGWRRRRFFPGKLPFPLPAYRYQLQVSRNDLASGFLHERNWRGPDRASQRGRLPMARVRGSLARSGRWGGKKLECGIHTFSEKA
jgi:hypothetical protein